jgi:hypothetical protein
MQQQQQGGERAAKSDVRVVIASFSFSFSYPFSSQYSSPFLFPFTLHRVAYMCVCVCVCLFLFISTRSHMLAHSSTRTIAPIHTSDRCFNLFIHVIRYTSLHASPVICNDSRLVSTARHPLVPPAHPVHANIPIFCALDNTLNT